MTQSIQPADKLPGSFGQPLIGETISLFKEQELFYWQRFQHYAGPFKTQILNRKIAILVGPEANQLVLKDEADKFSSKIGWSILEPLLGEGLLLQDGEKHDRTRKLMYPAFHSSVFPDYFNIVQDTVESFFDGWQKRNPILVSEEFRQLTLLIACRLLLGLKADMEVKQLVSYFSEIIAGIRTIVRWNIPFTKFGRALSARSKLEAFLCSIIEQRRRQVHKGQDILGLLLGSTDEAGNKLSDAEIITQILNLLFGAHETTAKLLSWTLLELSFYPQWVEKLRQEQTDVLQGNSFSFSHLKHLKQMGYVLKEIERLYPPIYSIPRGVIQDVEYGGYLIPPGWYVVISPLLTHRLSELYSQPNCFEPSRFAPPREEDRQHPFSLIGFGGGIHKCLGQGLAQMESKIILSMVLRRYDWSFKIDRSTVMPLCQSNKIESQMWAKLVKIQ